MRRFESFVVCLILLACSATGWADEVDVYLLGGQSNMQGIGRLNHFPHPPIEIPPKVFFWNGQTFEPLVPGKTQTSARPGEFGPELGFAHAIGNGKAPVYLIKHFASGMPLHHGWNGSRWVGGKPTPGRTNFYPGEATNDPNQGSLYREMIERYRAGLQALEKQGHTPVIRGLIWMQGEQDSKQAESAGTYAQSLKRLRKRVAEDLHVNRLPFVFGKVCPATPPLPRFKFRDLIRTQMDRADMASGTGDAIQWGRVVPTEGLGMRSDRIHYNAAGQWELGKRFANALKQIHQTGIDFPLWGETIPGFPDDYAHHAPKKESPGHWTGISRATIRVFPASHQNANGRSLIVFPGGGYRVLAADKEGDRVAAFFADRGFTSFVVRYRVSRIDALPFRFPGPLYDARQAIRFVKANASRYGIDPDQVGVIGFSAGGHLAAMCATRFEDNLPGELAKRSTHQKHSSDPSDLRPAFAALIYPVATMLEGAHAGSRKALFGAHPAKSELIAASPERRLTPKTPPLFMVQNEFDPVDSVPTLRLAIACKKQGVPCELHLYPKRDHGFGMGRSGDTRTTNPAIAWPKLLLDFLRRD